jgi:hypothetical protein
MSSKMAVGFVLLGFLAACTPESTNLNKEAMPSASPPPIISPSQPTSPIPSMPASLLETPVVPTATSIPSPSPISIAHERCTSSGELTYEHRVTYELIETHHKFNFQEVRAPRSMCHNANDDTLVITNEHEVLSLEPKTSKVETLIDKNLTGFISDQGKNFRFGKGLGECIVDKEGTIYIEGGKGSEVYRVDLKNKRITTLQHTPPNTVIPTKVFRGPVRFTLRSGQLLLSDTESIYLVNSSGTNLELLFRVNYIDGISTGATSALFPQRLNGWSSVEEILSIRSIASDDKDNIYIIVPNHQAVFKLTPEKKMYLINPVGSQQLYAAGASYLTAGLLDRFEYSSKYKVFFGRVQLRGPIVLTRDGCMKTLPASPDSDERIKGSIITDITSTNDGSVYALDSEKLNVFRLNIPPDLPEKAQWEPPQAWKDATGME